MTILGVRTNIVSPGYTGDFDHMAIPIEGCSAFFALGTSKSRSQNNGVRGAPAGQIVNSPAFSAYYATFQSGTSFLQFPSGIEQESGALIVVARSADTNSSTGTRPTLISSNVGGFDGVEISIGASTSVRVKVGVDEGAGPSSPEDSLALSDLTNADLALRWKCLVANYSSSRMTLYDVATGASTETEFAADSVRLIAPTPICIGGGPGVARTGLCDVAFGGVFSRTLSAPERFRLYVELKRLCASRGIVI